MEQVKDGKTAVLGEGGGGMPDRNNITLCNAWSYYLHAMLAWKMTTVLLLRLLLHF